MTIGGLRVAGLGGIAGVVEHLATIAALEIRFGPNRLRGS